jgi:predicted nucleotidyltransferase
MISERLRNTIVKRIRDNFDPDRIILFGSHARDSADDRSDIDLMIVKSGVQHRRDAAVQVYRALKGLGLPVDVMVTTPEIMEEYKDCWQLVYHDVAKEGQVIYERAK